MEITDRSDLGVDLKAPLRDDSGAEKWTYALLKEVRPGDVVLHWSTPERSVVAYSIADGEWWEEPIVWGAHGTAAREAGVVPYEREGTRRGLVGFTQLASRVTKQSLQDHRSELEAIRAELLKTHADPLYFPFQIRSDEIRATQGYLAKFPRALLDLWPAAAKELTNVGAIATSDTNAAGPTLGAAYRAADERASASARSPFSVDPNIVDRGTRGHARTQNALAAWVSSIGAEPLSPNGEPQFDLAWELDGLTYVAEVKSLTDRNEERQLRLGLGQVLRYRQVLEAINPDSVRAVLMVERSPKDASWLALCDSLRVSLLWPERLVAGTQLA